MPGTVEAPQIAEGIAAVPKASGPCLKRSQHPQQGARTTTALFDCLLSIVGSGAVALADHVVVVSGLADLVPRVLLVAERDHRIVELLEHGVLGRDFGKQLVRRVERGVEDLKSRRAAAVPRPQPAV